jgi:hypothetical protein
VSQWLPTGRAKSLGRQELVPAYELRQEGCRWALIARGLGVSPDYLQRRVKHCERAGIKWIAT